jgi:hypothetical protein
MMWASDDLRQSAKTIAAGRGFTSMLRPSRQIYRNVYVGANGHYLEQITDARDNGLRLPDSKEQIGAIGPGLIVNRNGGSINGYHESARRIRMKGIS